MYIHNLSHSFSFSLSFSLYIYIYILSKYERGFKNQTQNAPKIS